MTSPAWLSRYRASFSYVGLAFAAVFFAASLSPSLLPRNYIVQGLLSGIALSVGYGAGLLAVYLYQYLELPLPSTKTELISKRITTACVAITACVSLWRATIWQNSIRELMEMPPLKSAYPWRVVLIALIFGAFLIAFARLLGKSYSLAAKKINHVFPRRISNALSILLVATITIAFFNGVLGTLALDLADSVFSQLDEHNDDGVQQPTNQLASGSQESLIPWDSIGRQGKDFIAKGPTQELLSKFSENPPLQPLRIYVGLRSKQTMQERAKLALAELKRVGGFQRSLLVIATPTGTGWLDPGAVDTLEYIHAGDTAIVSMQYSYLPSWITILVDPNRSRDSAQALFNEVYAYWKTLPKTTRPKLYLQGLSLGSLGSESSADLLSTFEDPIQGALWSGPPFPSTSWAKLTRARNPDSPAWRPVFRDGTIVRFMGQANTINQLHQHWSPIRCIYLQHASDPMVFFSPSLFFHKPEWLNGTRGPDVSPYLEWYPIITFLQVAFDLPMATSVPLGYGHNYAPKNYLDAWIAITDPPNWNPYKTTQLKQHLKD